MSVAGSTIMSDAVGMISTAVSVDLVLVTLPVGDVVEGGLWCLHYLFISSDEIDHLEQS